MSDRFFQIADLEAEGVRADIETARLAAAHEARRILALPVGPLPKSAVDILVDMCREALVQTNPRPFLRVVK